ncbi:hypothetical protein IIM_01351 [Bacillus cereus VD107]|nr:hypothetical protein IIM_01351 [Bacillus cereus VD107]
MHMLSAKKRVDVTGIVIMSTTSIDKTIQQNESAQQDDRI